MSDFDSVTLETQQRSNLLDELCAYAETDLLCYFATEPRLYAQQQQIWEPVLKQIERVWSLDIQRTQGIIPVAQPKALKQNVRNFLEQYQDAGLVAMAQIITRLGSVFLAIALEKQIVTLDEALNAATLDEHYQAQEWGEDEAIQARLDAHAEKVRDAYSYLQSLGKAD